jgi:hypothetical protein
MTDTIEPVPDRIDQHQLAQQLVEAARAEGVELVGPGGLLTGLTKTVLETALEAEMSEHLGYDRHDPAGRDGGNSRNGTRAKTVLTEIGPVEIEVPRDRDAGFSPVIVRKRRRRLDGIDEIVLSLTARGLTTGEVAAHFAEVYGAKVSKDTISKITDKVLDDMAEWQNRPLDAVYPVIFIDAPLRQGPRRAGHQPALLRRHRRRRRVHRRLRRAQKSSRGDHHRLAGHGRADLRAAPDPQHLPLRLPPLLGADGQGSSAGLHRPDRGRRDLSALRTGTLGFTVADKQIILDTLGIGERASAYGLIESYGFATMTDADDPVRSSCTPRAGR